MKYRHRFLGLLLAAPSIAFVVSGACSADPRSDPPADQAATTDATGTGAGGGGGSSTTGGKGGEGGGLDIDAGRDSGLDPDAACANVIAEPTFIYRPIDVIVIVDNSGSMGDDILAVQDNLNDHLAEVLALAQIDFRLILISLHGWSDTAEAICIEKPLSSTDCNPIPAQPGQNPPIFFHYSTQVESWDSMCILMSSFDGTLQDDFGVQPLGWSGWLRPEAYKVFTAVTDDHIECGPYDDQGTALGGTNTANQIDADLLALSPEHFGDSTIRNYEWHSIIGMPAKSTPSEPWTPEEAVQLGTCPTGETPGTGYQALSILTGGLRFPICEHASYGPVFEAIAASAIAGAKLICDFDVPPPPDGEVIDLETVLVQYTDGNDVETTFQQVANQAACGPGKFYIEDHVIHLCPDTCAGVQDDPDAKLVVLFDCDATPR